MKTARFLSLVALILALPARVFCYPDEPVTLDNVVTFSGDQSEGVSYVK